MMFATLFARVSPASTSAKPACMKITNVAAINTNALSRLPCTISAVRSSAADAGLPVVSTTAPQSAAPAANRRFNMVSFPGARANALHVAGRRAACAERVRARSRDPGRSGGGRCPSGFGGSLDPTARPTASGRVLPRSKRPSAARSRAAGRPDFPAHLGGDRRNGWSRGGCPTVKGASRGSDSNLSATAPMSVNGFGGVASERGRRTGRAVDRPAGGPGVVRWRQDPRARTFTRTRVEGVQGRPPSRRRVGRHRGAPAVRFLSGAHAPRARRRHPVLAESGS